VAHGNEVAPARELAKFIKIGLYHSASVLPRRFWRTTGRPLFARERLRHGLPHRVHRGALSGPELPLRGPLRQEHLDPGDGLDSLTRRELHQSRDARAIDRVKK